MIEVPSNADTAVIVTPCTTALFKGGAGNEDVLPVPASHYVDLDGRAHVRLAIVLTEEGLRRYMESGFFWLDFRAENFPPFALYVGEPDELEAEKI